MVVLPWVASIGRDAGTTAASVRQSYIEPSLQPEPEAGARLEGFSESPRRSAMGRWDSSCAFAVPPDAVRARVRVGPMRQPALAALGS